jgi:Domain of unknown function (DUF4112)
VNQDAPLPTASIELRRARTIARWLDDAFLDPILGLVLPGVGDLIGSLFGLYLVSIAVRQRLPAIVIARMLLNLALDAGLGAVPVLGDAVDFAFRANRRNVALLESRTTRGSTWRDWAAVLGALALVLVAIGGLIYASIRFLQWLF